MKKSNAIIMGLEEYDSLLGNISEGNFGIQNENGEWFYVITEDADEDDDIDKTVYNMLSKELGVIVTDVIVDITNQKVVIICK